jgi:protein ImuA
MREISIQQIPNLWRADALTAAAPQLVSSGYAQLDLALGGGWPVPGLLEVLCDQWGIGELQLLLPLMKALSAPALVATSVCRPVLWINPPFEPQALALAQHGLQPTQHWLSSNLNAMDALWASEQSLRSGACAMVLCWLSGLTMPGLRRLKLAALSGDCVGVLFRPQREAAQTTAANLRLRLSAQREGLHVELLKVQGRRPSSVLLNMAVHQTRGRCHESLPR